MLDRAADIAVVSAAATRLYRRGIAAERPLDAIVSTFIKDDLKGTPRPLRGEVARLAQAMWRRRRLLEAIDLALSTGAGGKGGLGRHREAAAFATLVLQAQEEGRPTPALPLATPERDALIRVVDDVVKRSPIDVRASLPTWLCERLVQQGGEALALASTGTPPQTLRVNTLKTTRDALLATLRQQGLKVRPCERSPIGIVTDGRADIFRTPAFFDGTFEMQDEGSQLVALHAAAQPGERVVDGCAGAGGKTLAMAAQMGGTGTIVALDIHGGRLKALQERARRAGAHNVRAIDLEESGKILKRLKGSSDLVLVDAPCTGTGVLRRNPDTGWRLQPEDVERLTVLQRSLLDTYAPLVRPGGRMVYATCSLLAEENDGAITHFLASHPDFALEAQPLSLNPADTAPGGHWDGFFAATLRRAAPSGPGSETSTLPVAD